MDWWRNKVLAPVAAGLLLFAISGFLVQAARFEIFMKSGGRCTDETCNEILKALGDINTRLAVLTDDVPDLKNRDEQFDQRIRDLEIGDRVFRDLNIGDRDISRFGVSGG